MTDLISRVFGWGCMDVDFLEKLIELGDSIGADLDTAFEDALFDCRESQDVSINNYIYRVMYAIEVEALSQMQSYAEENFMSERLIQFYSDFAERVNDRGWMFINCLDSWWRWSLDDYRYGGTFDVRELMTEVYKTEFEDFDFRLHRA